jgi:hypothetical protein
MHQPGPPDDPAQTEGQNNNRMSVGKKLTRGIAKLDDHGRRMSVANHQLIGLLPEIQRRPRRQGAGKQHSPLNNFYLRAHEMVPAERPTI